MLNPNKNSLRDFPSYFNFQLFKKLDWSEICTFGVLGFCKFHEKEISFFQ